MHLPGVYNRSLCNVKLLVFVEHFVVFRSLQSPLSSLESPILCTGLNPHKYAVAYKESYNRQRSFT